MTFNKHTIDLEHHCIDRTLSHLRIAAPLQLSKLVSSMDAAGQLVPIIVVPANAPNRYVLIDGYMRVAALKKLGQDIVKAEVWECSEADALLATFANHGQRQWEAFEEAQVMRELQIRHGMSQEQIAERIGRVRSWVSHRLALLDALPDRVIKAIVQGHISTWTAQRVLVPVARATPQHAESLLKYLSHHRHSTRELADFFNHYQKTNRSSREKMVMQPELFFKAQKALQAEHQAKLLKAGPEGKWRGLLATISDQLKQLEKLVPELLYERQDEEVRSQLLEPLDGIQRDLNRILETSRGQQHDRQDDASNHYHSSSIGQELPAH